MSTINIDRSYSRDGDTNLALLVGITDYSDNSTMTIAVVSSSFPPIKFFLINSSFPFNLRTLSVLQKYFADPNFVAILN